MVSEDLPPSYDEAVRDELAQPQQGSASSSSGRTEAPPPDYSSVSGGRRKPLRDEKRPPPAPPRTSSSSLPKPPVKGSSKPSKLPARPNTQAPHPNLPWQYPPKYYCEKCHNTGYKIKNGKSCKRCWRRFAPTNLSAAVVTQQPHYSSGLPFGDYFRPFNNPPGGYYPQATPINSNALYVRPGDPRLGGVVCGECRGSGRVRFFLDENICPLCNGIGRIIR